MNINQFPIDETVALAKVGSWPKSAHYCHRNQFAAVVAAWHVGRPLLVRGEAGVGKSQLANAVAQILDWQFIAIGVQPQTEYTDLLWRFDAVARLATAQMLGAMKFEDADAKKTVVNLPEGLDHQRFVRPGPLWWAYRPSSAEKICEDAGANTCPFLRKPKKKGSGVVLLIDEIDKADSRLPNGLLEITGNGDFTPPTYISEYGEDSSELVKPLVIVTSNDERQLPVAFIRRCLVLDIVLPNDDQLVEYLTNLSEARITKRVGRAGKVPKTLRKRAAEEVAKRRSENHPGYKVPGVAEYIDLLEALAGIDGNKAAKEKQLDQLSGLILDKRVSLEAP